MEQAIETSEHVSPERWLSDRIEGTRRSKAQHTLRPVHFQRTGGVLWMQINEQWHPAELVPLGLRECDCRDINVATLRSGKRVIVYRDRRDGSYYTSA